MKQASDRIYALVDDEIRGPTSIWEAQQQLKDGTLPETALFAREGDTKWRGVEFVTSHPAGPEFRSYKTDFLLTEKEVKRMVWVILFVLLLLVGVASGAWQVWAVVFGIPIYFLPTYLARRQNHRNFAAIAALNILGGWTFFGWLVALVWVLYKPPGAPVEKPSPQFPSALPEPLSGSGAAEARRAANF